MKNIFTRFLPKRPLYIQLLFTVFAFFAMVILSCIFAGKIVRINLLRNADSVLDFVESQINSDLRESRVILDDFAQSVQNLVRYDYNAERLTSYNEDISSHLISKNNDTFSTNGPFGYIEKSPEGPFFFNGIGWKPSTGWQPMERPWYKAALKAGGGIAATEPYKDTVTGEVVFSYSRCIFDNSGNCIGVVAIDIRAGHIGEKVANTAFAKDKSYGVLVSDDFTIIGHINPDFVGMKMYDPKISSSHLVNDLLHTGSISEAAYNNWKGEMIIAFFRTLSNGWRLGLLAPKNIYYQSVNNMALILSFLGISLAAVLILILIQVDAEKNKSNKENRHKSAFLANMSHEIRTPMNAIIGMTTIGKSASDSVRKDYCLSKIEDASKHLLGVINDILDMSKIEANKFELSEVEFDLEKMLRRIVNVINFRIDEKHQKISVYIDRSIPRILIGDDQRIAQVITNLLWNAIKFTPEKGSIAIDVRLAGKENGICTLQISVSDSGIGISPEQQAKLFNSFEQAESRTTRKYGGTGLGLAISKSIVEMMGGSIWIESKPEKGSTFTFTIQLKHGTNVKHRPLFSDVNLKNVRVLIVDDDADVLTYFNDIAQSFGMMCDTAASRDEALEFIYQKGGYDIYFIDWKMPGLDGIQFAREIKAHAKENFIVTMNSAAEWSVIAEEAEAAGVDKFLSKPLFPSSILEIINECLGTNKQRAEKTKTDDIADIFAGRRVLLVEDVDINREIVQTLLEPTKLEIDCAENGVEAVRMFAKAPYKYNMIFMDIQMPEMDGYEATRRIRTIEAGQRKTSIKFNEGKIKFVEFPKETSKQLSERPKRVPIVAMTANVFKEDIEKCLAAGMDSHIGKPLDFDEVINKLNLYLGMRKSNKNLKTKYAMAG